MDGKLIFLHEKAYFPDPRKEGLQQGPQWPLEVELLVERTLAAEAQERFSQAATFYRLVHKAEPRLRAWAELGLARLDFEGGDASALTRLTTPTWSRSDGITPGGLPVALSACGGVETAPASQRNRFAPLIEATIEGLRAGRWWFAFEERHFYDGELRRLMMVAGKKPVADDLHLSELAVIEGAVRRSRPKQGVQQVSDLDATAAPVILWRPAQHEEGAWLGLAISRNRLAELVSSALRPVISSQAFPIAVRRANGPLIWTDASHGEDWTASSQLASVAGWELLFGKPGDSRAFDLSRLLWYGLTGLVVMMLVIGVAMTTHVVRREVELAKLQSEFLAAVTHEFKSPLTSIRLLMERLASGRLRAPSMAGEYHDAINRETDRLERLVNRVLESQKIQSGEKTFHLVPSSVVEIAESAIWRLRPQAESKSIAVDLELGGEVPKVAIDKASITDALDNLLDNAIKYSPANSRIQIKVERREGFVCVEVCDQGIGIDPDDLPRIFDRFYRGRRGDLENVQGTGLGLALVKAAAEGHGGTIRVSSSPGRGARFCLRLPAES
jgi:two-component system phosphate regulon sensor histidine kinase PhoR